jgi:hypothetical protein
MGMNAYRCPDEAISSRKANSVVAGKKIGPNGDDPDPCGKSTGNDSLSVCSKIGRIKMGVRVNQPHRSTSAIA